MKKLSEDDLREIYLEILNNPEKSFPDEKSAEFRFSQTSAREILNRNAERLSIEGIPEEASVLDMDPKKGLYVENCNRHKEVVMELWPDSISSIVPSSYIGTLNRGRIFPETVKMFGDHSCVVLLDIGLLNLIYQYSRIIVESIPLYIPQTGDSSRVEVTPLGELKSDFSASLNFDGMSDQLSGLIACALDGDPRQHPRIDYSSEASIELTLDLVNSTIRFILGHELSHGIVELESLIELSQLDDSVKDAKREEIRCDALSMYSTIHLFNKTPVGYRQKAAMMLVAPILFFDVMNLYSLEKGSSDVSRKNSSSESHPSDLNRRNALKRIVESQVGENGLQEFYAALSVIDQRVDSYLEKRFPDHQIAETNEELLSFDVAYKFS